MAYVGTKRAKEMGIRVVLSGTSRHGLGLILKNGLNLAMIGISVGLAGALVLTRLLASLLFGVTATDATTFAVVSGGLITVVLLACYIPARRATKVDPLVALRYE